MCILCIDHQCLHFFILWMVSCDSSYVQENNNDTIGRLHEVWCVVTCVCVYLSIFTLLSQQYFQLPETYRASALAYPHVLK